MTAKKKRLIGSPYCSRAAEQVAAALPHLVRFPSGRAWIDYDDEADVLYVSFKRPQKATDTVEKDGVLYRYRGKELVGITVLSASERVREKGPEASLIVDVWAKDLSVSDLLAEVRS